MTDLFKRSGEEKRLWSCLGQRHSLKRAAKPSQAVVPRLVTPKEGERQAASVDPGPAEAGARKSAQRVGGELVPAGELAGDYGAAAVLTESSRDTRYAREERGVTGWIPETPLGAAT